MAVLIVVVVFGAGFVLGFAVMLSQVKDNLKNGLLPMLDASGALSWVKK